MSRIFMQCLLALFVYIALTAWHADLYAAKVSTKKFKPQAAAPIKTATNTRQLKLRLPLAEIVQPETVSDAELLGTVWEKLVPGATPLEGLNLRGDYFKLYIDASRYPLYSTIDKGIVVLDQKGEIPPLVRELVEAQFPKTRIALPADDSKQATLAAMLAAGGFYSVEDQPLLTFGHDPKVTIRPDFKVEPVPDSVFKDRVMLLHTSGQKSPPELVEFLAEQGMQLLEPFAFNQSSYTHRGDKIVLLGDLPAMQAVDAILKAFSLSAEKDYPLELMQASKSGIGLSVTARRYFRLHDKPYVVAELDDDPVHYTLLRLLEAEGYNVIFLDQIDSAEKVLGKILHKFGLSAKQQIQQLVVAPDNSYTIEISGVTVHGFHEQLESTTFTSRPLGQKLQTVLEAHGFLIQEQVD